MTKMEAKLNKISEDLEFLKKKVTEIGKHMIDVDTILTPEEEEELDNSIERYKAGKSKDFGRVKKELGL